ncbi:TetR/AcrR family transcriptional regulator [Thauera sp. SDU_THAU2]|uniref:TetR/AcrR family transcriptional regulator n=1 Tax=Thauera sp. SDU_THAU2 TaxID=3136633 RepID=UPI00311DACA0
MSAPGTRESLLQTAESLLRSKGYAAFSYADLAQAIGIRKASIHYHFPTKEDLGVAVVEAYVEGVVQTFAGIEAEFAAVADRLEAFAGVFKVGKQEGQLPLCGALAAEMAVLPERLQVLTRRFFQLQIDWLTKVLDEGVKRSEIPSGIDTRTRAHQLLSQMEGASFVDWVLQGDGRFDAGILLRIAGVDESARPHERPPPG